MNKQELQELAEIRVADAETLLAAGRWAGAYYLLGYAVVCALKACAARRFLLHEVPERVIVERFYTHRLDQLLSISEIQKDFEKRTKEDPDFRINWNTVKDWNETYRYKVLMPEALARGLHTAITNETSGILPWLRTQY